jgi:CDP-paratose 2-epimerase
MKEKLGICQWFHYEAHDDVLSAVELMRELGVRHLRTGISWADYHRPGGREWYDWQMKTLAEFEVLLSIWHTPPSISENGRCSGPPRRLRDYADFIWLAIQRWGDLFGDLELWNEPNNRLKWDFRNCDPRWEKFGEMIVDAGNTARMEGKRTVLGGMIPVDPHWLDLMRRYGVLDHIDVVAIHGLPGMWWPDHPNWDWYSHWKGWPQKIDAIRKGSGTKPVWITETGLATWNLNEHRVDREEMQVRALNDAAAAPSERVYWYCLADLDPEREAIEGFHVDENEYHLGLVTRDGRRKPAWLAMKELLELGDTATTPHAASNRRMR